MAATVSLQRQASKCLFAIINTVPCCQTLCTYTPDTDKYIAFCLLCLFHLKKKKLIGPGGFCSCLLNCTLFSVKIAAVRINESMQAEDCADDYLWRLRAEVCKFIHLRNEWQRTAVLLRCIVSICLCFGEQFHEHSLRNGLFLFCILSLSGLHSFLNSVVPDCENCFTEN